MLILIVALAVVAFFLYRKCMELRQVKKSDRMMKAFLQNIHHEIRVPLKTVCSLASTVSKEDLYLSKNEKRNISEQIVYNSDLISTLIEELMMFTEAEDGGHPMKMESFSPNALCCRCLEANMLSIYHRQAVKMFFKRAVSDEFFVTSDRHMVELIVNKLIINACRFTEEGEVCVGCNTTENPNFLTIYVRDTGVGIPENRRANIFTFFEDPDDMNDEAELDLSICSKIAEKLNGQLVHDSTVTSGTRILLLLPLK